MTLRLDLLIAFALGFVLAITLTTRPRRARYRMDDKGHLRLVG